MVEEIENNTMERKTNGDRQSSDFPIWIVWQTATPVELDCGQVHAAGNAMPQVRSLELLAAVGNLETQIAHVHTAITGALELDVPTVLERTARRLRTRAGVQRGVRMQLLAA